MTFWNGFILGALALSALELGLVVAIVSLGEFAQWRHRRALDRAMADALIAESCGR